ncbi:hypothetical protein WQE_03282 [Paraburkholderia hospita]|uniref:Uncharacterized protein n=1 Tax=Paraburkholderia hospita TaxID=169430 RepID=A0ABN0FUU6_9BURK|nr:hypothetical protein WQE_03282 [Paraburkholderia hospita]OUL70687.1 hypothetical protein CA602_47760 [Paraburkholderia hospita]
MGHQPEAKRYEIDCNFRQSVRRNVAMEFDFPVELRQRSSCASTGTEDIAALRELTYLPIDTTHDDEWLHTCLT